LSQTSNVTPPIALAAFAGAGVANANPMKSSVEAFKLAGGLFIIPIMMAYTSIVNPNDGMPALLFSIVQTLTIIVAIAIAIEGYLIRSLNMVERLVALLAIPLLLLNPFGLGPLGIAIIIGLIVIQWRSREVAQQA
jgi:TRAP-type uncharacterized transport system fused permease subunit